MFSYKKKTKGEIDIGFWLEFNFMWSSTSLLAGIISYNFIRELLFALMKLSFVGRPVSSSPIFEEQPKVRGMLPNSQAYQDRALPERSHDHDTNIQAPKRTKSPEKPFVNNLRSAQTNLLRYVCPMSEH